MAKRRLILNENQLPDFPGSNYYYTPVFSFYGYDSVYNALNATGNVNDCRFIGASNLNPSIPYSILNPRIVNVPIVYSTKDNRGLYVDEQNGTTSTITVDGRVYDASAMGYSSIFLGFDYFGSASPRLISYSDITSSIPTLTTGTFIGLEFNDLNGSVRRIALNNILRELQTENTNNYVKAINIYLSFRLLSRFVQTRTTSEWLVSATIDAETQYTSYGSPGSSFQPKVAKTIHVTIPFYFGFMDGFPSYFNYSVVDENSIYNFKSVGSGSMYKSNEIIRGIV